eukprot:6261130-Alexandrium_andersonii.AAC.1
MTDLRHWLSQAASSSSTHAHMWCAHAHTPMRAIAYLSSVLACVATCVGDPAYGQCTPCDA